MVKTPEKLGATPKWEKTDLVFWEKVWNFQHAQFEVSKRTEKKGYVELKINDRKRDTCIKNVPVWKEQEVLDKFYSNPWVDKLFSKNIWIYSPTVVEREAPDVPGTEVDGVVADTRESIDETDETIGDDVPHEILHNQKALDILRSKGAIIEGGKIKNPEILEQYNKYVDVIIFLASHRESNQEISDAKRQEAVNNYLWLLSESSVGIWDKEYIAMKYSHILYNDIIRAGYFLNKQENGTYAIQRVQRQKATAKGTSITFRTPDFESGGIWCLS